MSLIEIFDRYLNGLMSDGEKIEFEARLIEDVDFATNFNKHQSLVRALQLQGKTKAFKEALKTIHQQEIGAKTIPIYREETFASRHGKTIAVAASTALIAVLSTVAVLSTGGYLLKQQSNQITDLNRVVMELQASNSAIVAGITKNNKKTNYAPANMEGSAFALNNKGYVITSYHMVKGADSIFVQNSSTERTLTKLILCDPKLDLAVLKIDNDATIKTWQVPFSFKEKTLDIGERVFTLGYPRKDIVYGEGSLSSLSGYSNDTSMYQVSIPVNPGNSGGPVLDEEGNVVGVIRGKISGAEATSFAIKANQILNSINSSVSDSLKTELSPKRKSNLRQMKRADQIKKINPYVFNVLVYKKD